MHQKEQVYRCKLVPKADQYFLPSTGQKRKMQETDKCVEGI